MTSSMVTPNWRDRFGASPLFYVVAFVFMAVTFPLVVSVMPGGSPRSFGTQAFTGIVFASSMTVTFVVLGRKARKVLGGHGADERGEISCALRTGEAPKDRSLDGDVRHLLGLQSEQIEKSAKLAPWLFGALALLGVVLAFTNSQWLWLGYTVFFVVAAVLTAFGYKRSGRRFDHLEQQLDSRGLGV